MTAQTPDTRGQSWVGDSVAESIQLCEYQTILPLLLEHLPKAGRILESGCGLGRWVFFLRERGFDLTGIDLARPALEMASAYDTTAPILLDDVLHSQFPDSSFDAAISLGVVEHFEEGPQSALAELRRVLRDDGILLISVPFQNPLRRLFTNHIKDVWRWYRKRKGASFVFEEFRYTVREFEGHLTSAGFEVSAVAPDDFRPPKNMGLYADFRCLRSEHGKWELNALGNILAAAFHLMSPWVACAGACWICRKLASQTARSEMHG